MLTIATAPSFGPRVYPQPTAVAPQAPSLAQERALW